MENKVICGDCLEVMKDIPDNYFDLVLTDPPYGINIGSSVGGARHLVKVGGESLSSPKPIGGLMILKSPVKNTLVK